MATNKEIVDDLFGSDEEEEDTNNSIDEKNNDGNVINRPKAFGVCTFHTGIEEMMWQYVLEHAPRNSPALILEAIDQFCMSKHWMMHIGQDKAEVIVNAIRETKQNKRALFLSETFIVVELGSYCGYSAVRIASELENQGNEKLFCLELYENCVGWTKRLVDYAGLSDRVTVIQTSAKEIENWKPLLSDFTQSSEPKINILFVDHDKKEYFHDLKKIVENNLLTSNSLVVADNVLSFNSPKQDYLDYVRDPNGPFRSSRLVEGFIEYCTEDEKRNDLAMMKDGIEISIFK